MIFGLGLGLGLGVGVVVGVALAVAAGKLSFAGTSEGERLVTIGPAQPAATSRTAMPRRAALARRPPRYDRMIGFASQRNWVDGASAKDSRVQTRARDSPSISSARRSYGISKPLAPHLHKTIEIKSAG